jgi:hypothetical protein
VAKGVAGDSQPLCHLPAWLGRPAGPALALVEPGLCEALMVVRQALRQGRNSFRQTWEGLAQRLAS